MRSEVPVFALIVTVGLVIYGLNKGVFVGSTVKLHDGYYYSRFCDYLFPSGIATVKKGGESSMAAAEQRFCRFFHD